ncbi:MAG: sialate O-acetylesterase [Ruminococcus sp.]|nr:sialate O-acetylesterase [Ruminococcus sp.]
MVQAAAVFSSHMVLQRDKRIAVFGSGTPGESVTVRIPEKDTTVSGTVKADGTWLIYLPAMEGGLALTMTVSGADHIQEFTDVVTGEVWLAGGQSNMEFFLKNAKGGAEELRQCSAANVRCYNVYRNIFMDDNFEKTERTNSWKCASEENAGEWSAVAYWAAKELSGKLGMPVGIIGCNLGGTSASCWMPKEDLLQNRETEIYWTEYENAIAGKTDAEMIADYDAYVEYHTAWEKRMQACYQENGNMKWTEVIERCGENRWPGPMNIKNPLRPAGTYTCMLSRVSPYTIRGFWYYQGENDDHRPDTYSTLLTAMIHRWRKDWGDAQLPFILTMLPVFCYDDAVDAQNWCRIREAQLSVFRNLRNTGLTVPLECGEFGNIHPADKQPVAHRLALQAMHLVYGGAEKDAFGPIYRDFSVADDTLTLYFDHAEEGITLTGDGAGFELAAEDGTYVPAKAAVCGSTVRLTAEGIRQPARARYAWKNFTPVSLYGKNGIPAVPFRTCREESWEI